MAINAVEASQSGQVSAPSASYWYIVLHMYQPPSHEELCGVGRRH